MNFLLDDPQSLYVVFPQWKVLLHPDDTLKMRGQPEWVFTTTRDIPHPSGYKCGFVDGGRNYRCVYGLLEPSIRDRILPLMTEGKLGSMRFVRWNDGRLVLFACSADTIATVPVCVIDEGES